MLNFEILEKKIKETSYLLNVQEPKSNAIKTFYRKFRDYNHDDVLTALDEIAEEGEKISYFNILKRIKSAATKRKEEEWQITKRKEKEEVEEVMVSSTEASVRLRSILLAIEKGPEVVEKLAKEYEQELLPKKCKCKDGYVSFSIMRGSLPYAQFGHCSKCLSNISDYPNLPIYDPETFERVK